MEIGLFYKLYNKYGYILDTNRLNIQRNIKCCLSREQCKNGSKLFIGIYRFFSAYFDFTDEVMKGKTARRSFFFFIKGASFLRSSSKNEQRYR